MKRILLACIALLTMLGCSTSGSTGPTLAETSLTNDNPVTGQRIFAQVDYITDNPPMTYQWTGTGGVFDIPDTAPFSTFWIAPNVPGPYTLTCTVTDNQKKKIARTFTIQVRARSLESNLVGTGLNVLTMAKESEYKIGGIWASVKDNKLRFISSGSNEESTWSMNFFTILNHTDPTTQIYTIWGVESSGNNIIELTSSTETTLVCETCLNIDKIKALAQDVLDNSILWVGTDSGLHYYTPATGSTTALWTQYLHAQVYDLSEGPEYVYAATNQGIFRTDGTKTPIYGGDTCAVLAVDNGTTSPDVWSVVQGKIQKDGRQLDVQPPDVACSLDNDPSGNIWCGKYWWDGSQWHVVPGLDSITIVKSVASTEGLTYFLSDSGVLYRW
ncbi:MAG: hypothetical protein ABSC14_02135 [Desulfomonilia bacterium]